MNTFIAPRAYNRRRGAVAPLVAVLIPVLISFAALAIDVGYMYVVRAQLQNAADAAAMAGVSVYLEDIALSEDQTELAYLATQRAQEVSRQNLSTGDPTLLAATDLALGRHDFDNRNGALLPNGRWNAVQVTVRRCHGSLNGPVILFFANIFGVSDTEMVATARAAMDDRFAGYRIPQAGYAGLIPFTIHEDLYESQVENGPDDFSYDGQVKTICDDIPEISLYPWKWTTDPVNPGGNDGAGNFGTLCIGIDNMGTQPLREQILNGISAEQLESEFGTSMLVFGPQDDEDEENGYWTGGNPGMSAGMKDALEARIGDIVGFFIHSTLVDPGANATYYVTGIRFSRIMDVNMTGNPDDRSVTLQPVAYSDPSIIVTDPSPSTEGQIIRPMLVQ